MVPTGGSSSGDSRTDRRPIPDRDAVGLLGVAEVAQQRPGEAQQDEVEKGDEADLEQQQDDHRDVLGQPRTDSISVSPIRMMSPGPSAISVTGWPFTDEPLRLPRSVKPYAPSHRHQAAVVAA